MEGDIIQYFCFVIITEGNMIKGYITVDRRHLCNIISICNFRWGIHDFEYTLCTCNICDQLIIEITQIHNRIPEHGDVGTECNQKTNLFCPNAKNSKSDIKHGDRSESPTKINNRIKAVCNAYRIHKAVTVFFEQSLKSSSCFGFCRKALYNSNTGHIFMNVSIQIRRFFTKNQPAFMCLNLNHPDSDCHNRNRNQ